MAGGGAMAQGMEAELTQGSGLASVRCAEPGSDLWFLGPGQQNGGSQVQLDLMNVDSTAASVDVSVINDGGQVQAGNDNGITVPPHQTVTESLSSAAHGSSVLAIEVHTSIGRVAADVSAESHGVTELAARHGRAVHAAGHPGRAAVRQHGRPVRGRPGSPRPPR